MKDFTSTHNSNTNVLIIIFKSINQNSRELFVKSLENGRSIIAKK